MRYLSLGLLIILSGCRYDSKIDKRNLSLQFPSQTIPQRFTKTPPITIFIHGTKLIRHPQFHTIFNNTPGLVAAHTINPTLDMYKRIKTFSDSSPECYPFDHCYVFGWSGKLSSKERRIVAQKLHHEIEHLIKQYKKQYNCNPEINVIAHSHGSNLALNLGAYALESDPSYIIHSLILLACPVQTETMYYINSPLFTNIYALYSSLDLIQIIAPQIVSYTYIDKDKVMKREKYYIPRMSSRKFPPHEKLIQTRVKINKHAIGHKSFVSHKFLRILPHVIDELTNWKHDTTNIAMQSREKVLRVHVKKTRYF